MPPPRPRNGTCSAARPGRDILDKAADLYERDRARLIGVMVREAGKTLENALADLREAIDFLRYYAAEARRLFAKPLELKGPTGETNTLTLRARGPFACISPWNFPLAIFTGQVAAALAAGNPVLAKPAEQTPHHGLPRHRSCCTRPACPADVLQLLPGAGEVGAALVRDTRVAGVAFTGSNDTAALDPAGARRARRPDRALHRRDRRHQRHDRRLRARCPSR